MTSSKWNNYWTLITHQTGQIYKTNFDQPKCQVIRQKMQTTTVIYHLGVHTEVAEKMIEMDDRMKNSEEGL